MSCVSLFPIPNPFQFNIRRQFTFTVDDPTLQCILLRNVEPPEPIVNITGVIITKVQNGNGTLCSTSCNLVKMVVGPPEQADPNQDAKLRAILIDLGVIFQEYDVLQLLGFPAGQPGIIRGVYGSLFCRGTDFVRAIYNGEALCPSCTVPEFLDVGPDPSNLQLALTILPNRESNQCPLTGCGTGSATNCTFC